MIILFGQSSVTSEHNVNSQMRFHQLLPSKEFKREERGIARWVSYLECGSYFLHASFCLRLFFTQQLFLIGCFFLQFLDNLSPPPQFGNPSLQQHQTKSHYSFIQPAIAPWAQRP